MTSIHPLHAADLAPFKVLRLEALSESPEAFGASYEENLMRPDAYFLQLIGQPPSQTFGAYDKGRLIGKAGFVVEVGVKSRHKGFMWGVYVTPDRRGQGVGRQLVSAVITHARLHVEILRSAVVATNSRASTLYKTLGFETYGVEPRALKVGEAYFDEELIALRFR